MQKEKVPTKIKIGVDTNILIDLHAYNTDPVIYKKNCRTLKHFLEIKYLDKAVQEDLDLGRFSKFYFCYTPQVKQEMLNGLQGGYDMRVFNYARAKDFEPYSISETEEEGCNYLYKLLMGRIRYYDETHPEFSDSLFEIGDSADAKITSQMARLNMTFLTSNASHYIGIDDSVRQGIAERFEVAEPFVKRKFGFSCKDTKPITIAEFIEAYRPDLNNQMQIELGNTGATVASDTGRDDA